MAKDCTECGGKNKQSLEYEFYCKATSEIAGGVITKNKTTEWDVTATVVTGAFTIPEGKKGFSIFNITKVADWTLNGGTINALVPVVNGGGLNANDLTKEMTCDANGNTLQLLIQN